jgi:hypothetical protein
MNWVQMILDLDGEGYAFNRPASEEAILSVERHLGVKIPEDLKDLLMQTNGVGLMLDGEPVGDLLWPVERIISQNIEYRTDSTLRQIYSGFDSLLFFADAGNGDSFAYSVSNGIIEKPDIFVWDHEDDSRSPVAASLQGFIEGWIEGKITV